MKQRQGLGSFFFFFFFCILFLLSMTFIMTTRFVEAQSCTIDREGMPNECDSLLDFSYFIPPASYNITRDDIAREATMATLSLSAIDDDCRIPATKFACASAYQECTFYPISTSLPNFFVFPLPRSPCKSLCEDMVKHCKGVLPDENLPNCTAINSSGQSQYPKSSTEYEVLDSTYSVPCNPEKNSTVGAVEECPLPLKLRNDGKADPPCQLPCPVPYWTEKQYHAVIVTIEIGAPITVVCSLWLMWCWIAQERLRVFPAHLPIFAALGPLIAGVVWIISSIIGHEEIWCVDEFTPAGSNLTCGTQAFFLQMAMMIDAFYWFFIALTLFMLIVLEINTDHYPWYKYVVHSIGLGAPVAIAVVMFAAENYEGGGLGWCGPGPDHHMAYAWSLEYSWIMLFLILNNVFVLGVFGKITYVRSQSKKSERLNWRHVGMLIFTLMFSIVFGWGVAFVIYLTVVNDKLEQGIMDWVLCSASLGHGCKDTYIPSYWFFYLVTFLWVFSGLWVVIGFGMRKTLHKRGLHYFREVVLRGNWQLLKTGFTEAHISSLSTMRSKTTSKHKSHSNQRSKSQSPPSSEGTN